MILRAAALIRTMSTSAASKIQGGVKNASGVKKVPTGEGVNARDVASAASGVLRRGVSEEKIHLGQGCIPGTPDSARSPNPPSPPPDVRLSGDIQLCRTTPHLTRDSCCATQLDM